MCMMPVHVIAHIHHIGMVKHCESSGLKLTLSLCNLILKIHNQTNDICCHSSVLLMMIHSHHRHDHRGDDDLSSQSIDLQLLYSAVGGAGG